MGLVLVNGVTVGSINTSVLIGGVVVTGIKKLDITKSQKKENVMGFQSQPVARGRSGYDYPEATLTILLEEYKAIVAAAPNRDVCQVPMFNIPVVYDANVLQPELVNNVEFTSVKRSYSAGDGAYWIDLSCIFAGLNE